MKANIRGTNHPDQIDIITFVTSLDFIFPIQRKKKGEKKKELDTKSKHFFLSLLCTFITMAKQKIDICETDGNLSEGQMYSLNRQ